MNDPRTVLITGATDGLGRGLADKLAADGVTLILHGRDRRKLDAAADHLRAAHGGQRPHTVLADLADLAQIRRLAGDVRGAAGRLDGLLANARIRPGHPA